MFTSMTGTRPESSRTAWLVTLGVVLGFRLWNTQSVSQEYGQLRDPQEWATMLGWNLSECAADQQALLQDLTGLAGGFHSAAAGVMLLTTLALALLCARSRWALPVASVALLGFAVLTFSQTPLMALTMSGQWAWPDPVFWASALFSLAWSGATFGMWRAGWLAPGQPVDGPADSSSQ